MQSTITNTLNLRAMTLNDLPQCDQLAAPIYYPDLWEPIEAFAQRIRLYPQGCWIAEIDEKLAGYLYSHPWKQNQIVPLADIIQLPQNPDCYYIHDLAVSIHHRQLGIGKLLAEKAIAISTFPIIKLVSVLNSHNFWQRFNFNIISKINYAPGINGYTMMRFTSL